MQICTATLGVAVVNITVSSSPYSHTQHIHCISKSWVEVCGATSGAEILYTPERHCCTVHTRGAVPHKCARLRHARQRVIMCSQPFSLFCVYPAHPIQNVLLRKRCIREATQVQPGSRWGAMLPRQQSVLSPPLANRLSPRAHALAHPLVSFCPSPHIPEPLAPDRQTVHAAAPIKWRS